MKLIDDDILVQEYCNVYVSVQKADDQRGVSILRVKDDAIARIECMYWNRLISVL